MVAIEEVSFDFESVREGEGASFDPSPCHKASHSEMSPLKFLNCSSEENARLTWPFAFFDFARSSSFCSSIASNGGWLDDSGGDI